MLTLVFVLAWVVLGLGLLLIALSGGPSGALQRMQSQSRGSRKAWTVMFVIALLVLGVGVPLAVISSASTAAAELEPSFGPQIGAQLTARPFRVGPDRAKRVSAGAAGVVFGPAPALKDR